MEYSRTEIPDVILCKPTVHDDERGYFFESFRKESLEAFINEEIQFCQDNEAKSSYGVLRGLHYQLDPFAQSKLVRVIKGKILDVVVDIREGSKTFGKHVSVELNDESKEQLFIPKGFAHGYVVLSQESIVSYKVDNYYHKESERGILYNDATLQIDWGVPMEELIISGKDLKQDSFKQADYFNR